jgi:tetratricopeptide (TPR) repeat protein
MSVLLSTAQAKRLRKAQDCLSALSGVLPPELAPLANQCAQSMRSLSSACMVPAMARQGRFAQLPRDALDYTLLHCDARSLAQLGCTSRFFGAAEEAEELTADGDATIIGAGAPTRPPRSRVEQAAASASRRALFAPRLRAAELHGGRVARLGQLEASCAVRAGGMAVAQVRQLAALLCALPQRRREGARLWHQALAMQPAGVPDDVKTLLSVARSLEDERSNERRFGRLAAGEAAASAAPAPAADDPLPLYERVLAVDPANIVALSFVAGHLMRQAAGRRDSGHARAMDLYWRILASDADHLPTLRKLAPLLKAVPSKRGEAIFLYRRALALPGGDDAAMLYSFAHLLGGAPEGHEEAAETFRRVLAIEPAHVNALTQLASLLKRKPDARRREEAEALYRSALAAKPHHVTALNGLGNLLAGDARRRGEAEGLYRQALSQDPRFVPALTNLARALGVDAQSVDRNGEEIMSLHRRTLDIEPGCIEALAGLAQLLAQQQHRLGHGGAEATQLFRKVLKQQPNRAGALSGLATLLLEGQGDGSGNGGASVEAQTAEASDLLRQLLQIEPQNAVALNKLANTLLDTAAHTAEAVGLYRRVLAVDPQHVNALTQLAITLEEREHKTNEAMELWRRCLQAAPENIVALNNLARLVTAQPLGRGRKEAERIWRRVLQLDSGNSDALRNLGTLLSFEAGTADEACALLQRALQRLPDDVELLDSLATLLMRMPESRAEALQLFRRTVAIDAGPERLLNLASLLCQEPDGSEEGQSLYRRVLTTYPKHKSALTKLADELLLRHDGSGRDEAEMLLRRVLEAFPDDVEALTKLANQLLRQTKRRFEAESLYRRVLTADKDNACAKDALQTIAAAAAAEMRALAASQKLAMAANQRAKRQRGADNSSIGISSIGSSSSSSSSSSGGSSSVNLNTHLTSALEAKIAVLRAEKVNQYKIAAYVNAVAALRHHESKIVDAAAARRLDGVGKSIEAEIASILCDGGEAGGGGGSSSGGGGGGGGSSSSSSSLPQVDHIDSSGCNSASGGGSGASSKTSGASAGPSENLQSPMHATNMSKRARHDSYVPAGKETPLAPPTSRAPLITPAAGANAKKLVSATVQGLTYFEDSDSSSEDDVYARI